MFSISAVVLSLSIPTVYLYQYMIFAVVIFVYFSYPQNSAKNGQSQKIPVVWYIHCWIPMVDFVFTSDDMCTAMKSPVIISVQNIGNSHPFRDISHMFTFITSDHVVYKSNQVFINI